MTPAVIEVNGEKWFSSQAMMDKLNVTSRSSITKLYRKGLKCTKIGKSFYVREADLKDYLLWKRDRIFEKHNPR